MATNVAAVLSLILLADCTVKYYGLGYVCHMHVFMCVYVCMNVYIEVVQYNNLDCYEK